MFVGLPRRDCSVPSSVDAISLSLSSPRPLSIHDWVVFSNTYNLHCIWVRSVTIKTLLLSAMFHYCGSHEEGFAFTCKTLLSDSSPVLTSTFSKMHFLAVALVYAAADSSKDSDTTLPGEVKNKLSYGYVFQTMNDRVWIQRPPFLIVQPTDIDQVWVVLSHDHEHPASQNRRFLGSRRPFALKQQFGLRAEVEGRSTHVHKKSSHLSKDKYRVKLQICRHHPAVMTFYAHKGRQLTYI